MRMLLTLVAILSFTSCRTLPGNPPDLPEIDYQYAVILDKNGTPFCVRYNIISLEPYQVDRRGTVLNIKACQGMNGFLLRDFQKGLNWAEDIRRWATGQD